MRKHILLAGLAGAALIPTLAVAQQTCEQQRTNRVVGTVAGAGIGALAGSAVAGRDDRTAGALIGGVAGGLIGNQVTRGSADCARAYGYYDSNGLWHATGVDRAAAQGYYDREGQWVAGPPNGYYDAQNRWVAATSSVSASGGYDANGRWVPASANGYYDVDGRWIAGVASGYYANGRWIAGPATGRYDETGRWMAGQAGGRLDPAGQWIADPQPGYYDTTGRWRAGAVNGYYDAQGRWTTTLATVSYSSSNGPLDSRSLGGPADFASRVTRLEQRIRRGMSDGSLSRMEANRALRDLSAIRMEESRLPHQPAMLYPADEARIGARLDNLSAGLRLARSN